MGLVQCLMNIPTPQIQLIEDTLRKVSPNEVPLPLTRRKVTLQDGPVAMTYAQAPLPRDHSRVRLTLAEGRGLPRPAFPWDLDLNTFPPCPPE